MASKKNPPKKAGSEKKSELETLIQMLSANGVTEYESESGGKRVRISFNRPSAGAPSVIQTAVAQPQAIAAPVQQPTVLKAEAKNPKHKEFLSPLVGTFYSAPSPGAPDYAKVGQAVKAGDVLCIIEAMKLMNEIEAEFGGKIVSVLAENGQPVAFGDPLFLIET